MRERQEEDDEAFFADPIMREAELYEGYEDGAPPPQETIRYEIARLREQLAHATGRQAEYGSRMYVQGMIDTLAWAVGEPGAVSPITGACGPPELSRELAETGTAYMRPDLYPRIVERSSRTYITGVETAIYWLAGDTRGQL